MSAPQRLERGADDDSSQDPDQPPVGPAIAFPHPVVPDDQQPSDPTPPPPGEVIDWRRAREQE